jgi:orotidine-5'-phosphate decarboxylase
MSTSPLSPREKLARDRVCLALDLNDEREILGYVDELVDLVGYFKINSAFTLFGPALVKRIVDKGAKVFLDLKLHDIPNTVEWYGDAVTRVGAHIVTLHVDGGTAMMRAAVEGASRAAASLGRVRPKLIGITLLTSIDQDTMNREMNVAGALRDEVLRRARLAAEAGLDGIVCSAAELDYVRPHLPKDFFIVTPGVRPAGVDGDDHRRVASYGDAVRAGSSLLVVGRAVLGAADRRAAAREVLGALAAER